MSQYSMIKERKYLNSKTEYNFHLNCCNAGYKTTKSGYPDFLIYKIDKKNNKIAFCFVEVKKGKKQLRNRQKWIFSIFRYYGIPVYLLRDGNIPPFSHFRTIPYKEFIFIKKHLFEK